MKINITLLIFFNLMISILSFGQVKTVKTSSTSANNYVPVFSSDSTIIKSPFYLSGANVGLGTTTPSKKLDVRGEIRAVNSWGSGLSLIADSAAANSFSSAQIYLFDGSTSKAGYYGMVNAPSAGTPVMMFRTSNWASVYVWGNTKSPGAIGNFQESMRLGNQGSYLKINRSNSSLTETFGSSLQLSRNDTTRWTLHGGISSNTDKFSIRNSSSVDRLTILQDGKIGIGTTSPSSLLHVSVTSDASYTANNGFIVGDVAGTNIIMDANEILARNNGASSSLAIQADGGDLSVRNNLNDSLKVIFRNDGRMLIGSTTPPPGWYKFSVNGSIKTKEVVVDNTNWPDFVFTPEYKLKSLEETELFIKENKHLPEIPSAEEVKENGVAVGEMQAMLLKKIEELTLHMIEQEKRIKALEIENNKLKSNQN